MGEHSSRTKAKAGYVDRGVSSERLCWWGKLWHRSIPLAYPLKDSQTGIVVPACRVELIAKKPDLLLRRFDRDGARRIPFLSPMSMLGSKDDETRLSPAYGLNRVPTEIKRRILSAAINEDDDPASLGPSQGISSWMLRKRAK
jgi:hypothetical protein